MKATKAAALIVLVLAALTTLFVGSASAWHVIGVKAHCDQSKPQTLHVQVKLSDAGPGVYHDNFGKHGTFGHAKTFNYKTDVFGKPYRVTVIWNTGERGEFGPVTLRHCNQEEPASTTTTTIPSSTSTTTSPSSTSTTTKPPTSSTTIASTLCHDMSIATIKRVIQGLCPTTSTSGAPQPLPKPKSFGPGLSRPQTTTPKALATTGSSTTPMIELGVCVLAAGAALVAGAKRRAT